MGTAVLDIDTLQLTWTDGMYRLHGAPPGGIDLMGSGRNPLRFVHPDDRERVQTRLAGGDFTDPRVEVTYRIVGVDGQTRHVRCMQVREHDAAGRATRLITTVLDITDAVRAQEKLTASEEQFRTAFAAAPIGMVICRVSEHCPIVDANDAFCDFLGRPRDSVIGASILDFNHPEDRNAAHAQLSVLLSGDVSTVQYEKRFLRGDGTPRWSRITASLVWDMHGGIATTIARVEDVTDRRLAEERLVYQAGHDALTGLPNRMLLVDRLEHALARLSRFRGVSSA